VIDALDETAVDTCLQQVADGSGPIDIEINATGPRAADYGSGIPAIDLPIDLFLTAQKVLASQFITARCAARRMISRGSGVIIFLTGSPARPHTTGTAAIGAAFAGIENLTRLMALELTGTGVRVVCLRTAANPDSRTIQDVADAIGQQLGITRAQALGSLADGTMLKASPHTQDTANGGGPPRIRSSSDDDRYRPQRHCGSMP
jgi:3-oxoacyl-[acyl-carrier protein] reductase